MTINYLISPPRYEFTYLDTPNTPPLYTIDPAKRDEEGILIFVRGLLRCLVSVATGNVCNSWKKQRRI